MTEVICKQVHEHMNYLNDVANQILNQQLDIRDNADSQSQNTEFGESLTTKSIELAASCCIFDDLPIEIIHTFALFLTSPEQSRFLRVSKSTMTAIRYIQSPMSIHQDIVCYFMFSSAPTILRMNVELATICADLTSTYTAVCWHLDERLRHLNHLELDLSHEPSTHFLMTEQIPVTSLVLLNFSHPHSQRFFASNPDLSQITTLTLDERDWIDYEAEVLVEPFEVVVNALSSCFSLQSLSLGTCGSDLQPNNLEINISELDCLQNLKHFSAHDFYPDIVCHQILQQHGARLESVHLHQHWNATDWSLHGDQCTYDLSECREMCIGQREKCIDLEVINKSGCDKLKRVRIESAADWSCPQTQIVSRQQVDWQLVELLKNEEIEFIDLSIYDIPSLMEAVKVKRERLKVRVHSRCSPEEIITDQLSNILTLMNDNCKDWMFIATMTEGGECRDEPYQGLLNQMEEWMFTVRITSGYRTTEQDTALQLLTISKQESTIVGYREKWLSNCKWCEQCI